MREPHVSSAYPECRDLQCYYRCKSVSQRIIESWFMDMSSKPGASNKTRLLRCRQQKNIHVLVVEFIYVPANCPPVRRLARFDPTLGPALADIWCRTPFHYEILFSAGRVKPGAWSLVSLLKLVHVFDVRIIWLFKYFYYTLKSSYVSPR